MEKVTKEGMGSDQGFTMIELIIVIAIVGILAAVLVPSFTQMTTKSRLKADISTVRQVQTQIDLYVADNDGRYPTDKGEKPTDTSLTQVVKNLVKDEYIKESDTDGAGKISYQTQGVETKYSDTADHIILYIKGADPKVTKIGGKLTPKEKEWMDGYDTTTDEGKD